MAIALVGSLGTYLAQTTNSIQPSFGQSTTAGNLLIAWVTQRNDTVNQITTSASGWSQAVQKQGSQSAAAIFYKANCASGETSPVFGATNAVRMVAQLAEFSGPTTIPVDQTGTLSGVVSPASPLSVTAGGADMQSGELQVTNFTWINTTATSVTTADTYGSNATAVNAGNGDGIGSFEHCRFTYAITTANNISDTCSESNTQTTFTEVEAVIASFAKGIVVSPASRALILIDFAPIANTPGIPPSVPLILTGFAPRLTNTSVVLIVGGVTQTAFIAHGRISVKLQTADFALIDPSTIPALNDAVTIVCTGVIVPDWSGTAVSVTRADIVDLATGHKLITISARNSNAVAASVAPFGLSDIPDGTTTFGYRGLTIQTNQNTDGTIPTMGTCTVYQSGLGPGMIFHLTSGNLGYSAQAFSVANVTVTFQHTAQPVYLIEFGNIPIPLAQAGGGILQRQ